MGDVVLISTAEFTLKSGPVRRILERLLASHVRLMLSRAGLGKVKLTLRGARLVVEGASDARAAARVCARIFGVAYADPAVRTRTELLAIISTAVELATRSIHPGETFAVRAHCIGDAGLERREVESRLGGEILDRLAGRDVKVDLDRPDRTIFLEIEKGLAHIFTERHRGPGGLPVGSQGKVVGLLADGLNSLAAFYAIMRRGALVIPVYFESEHDGGQLEQVIRASRKLRELVPKTVYRLYVVPPLSTLVELPRPHSADLLAAAKKRHMFRVCSRLAKSERALGIVSGEAFAAQPGASLAGIGMLSEVADVPVHRPIIGLNAEELESLIRNVTSEDFESLRQAMGREAEALISPRCSRAEIEELEKKLDVERLVKESLAQMRKIEL